jgi:hypothetical protein
VFREYLPELGSQAGEAGGNVARRGAVEGHHPPAISPDGSMVAFFSERDGYSIDMFLADAGTGQVKRRLLKPTWSSNYETFRFLNSQALVQWGSTSR